MRAGFLEYAVRDGVPRFWFPSPPFRNDFKLHQLRRASRGKTGQEGMLRRRGTAGIAGAVAIY